MRCSPASSDGVMPIIVRPLVSKLNVATTGNPVVRAPATRRLGFLDGRHGLDPQEIRAAALQGRRLLGKRLARSVEAQGTERFEDLSGRTDAAGDQHDASGAVGFGARDRGRLLVELRDPIGRLVQLQP